MYPSSFYSSSNPRDDSHRHYRDKSVPDDSPALSTATPTAILKYPCPIWIRMEFIAGIYKRCLVSSWQHSMLSAPAGNDKRESRITSPKWMYNRLVMCIYFHLVIFYTTGEIKKKCNQAATMRQLWTDTGLKGSVCRIYWYLVANCNPLVSLSPS